jgi:glyoxylase-like metal-dependent hydrolase (beta-lactamase superfamily II)
MIKIFTTALLLATLTACAASNLAPLSPPTVAPTPTWAFTAEAVAPHISVLHQVGFHAQPRGNVEVIEQTDGIVLIDSGGSPAGAEEVISFVHGVTHKAVTAIVITHWHSDHSLGVARLKREWPNARVISTPATRDMLADPRTDRFMPGDNAEANARLQQNLASVVAAFSERSQHTELTAAERTGYAQAAAELQNYAHEMETARRITPTETFSDHLTLPDRTTPIELMFLGRANTEGDAVAWLPRQRVMITGDIVVSPIPYGFDSYPSEWLSVLQRIRAYNYAVLLPGHGMPMRDKSYLDKLIAAIAAARAQAATLAPDAAVTQENVGQHVDFADLRRQFIGDDPWLTRWFNGYWSTPIAWSALREARHTPIVQGG